MHFDKGKKRFIISSETIYCVVITAIVILLVLYTSLTSYSFDLDEKNKVIEKKNQKIDEIEHKKNNIIEKKNQEIKKLMDETEKLASIIYSDTIKIKTKIDSNDNDNILEQIQKPPEIHDPVDIVICENSYIEGMYIITDNINKFIFMNHFHSVTIICSNKKEYVIKNSISYSNLVSLFLNNDLSYWNGLKKITAEKSELLCQNSEVSVGLLYKKRDNKFHILCKNTTEEVKTNTKYFSPIYANIKQYFVSFLKKIVHCGKKFVSDINFIVKKDTKYMYHINLVCQQEKNTNNLLFNKISIKYGDYIDSVSYFKDNVEFPCDECSNGGVKHEFECPANMNITGHYEWHDKDNLVGIQFICE
jgi:hypothetical protein